MSSQNSFKNQKQSLKDTLGLRKEEIIDFGTAIPSALTYNFAPKIAGKIGALYPEIWETEEKDYTKRSENIRDKLRNLEHFAQKRSPKAYLAGDIVGGVLSPVGKILAPIKFGPKLATGVLEGALSGLGRNDTEDIENIGESVGQGVGSGAVGALLGHGIGKIANKVAGKLPNGIRKTILEKVSPDNKETTRIEETSLRKPSQQDYLGEKEKEVIDNLTNLSAKKKVSYDIPDTLSSAQLRRLKLAEKYDIPLTLGQITLNPHHINFETMARNGEKGIKLQNKIKAVDAEREAILKELPDKLKATIYKNGIAGIGEYLPSHIESIAKKSVKEKAPIKALYEVAYGKKPIGEGLRPLLESSEKHHPILKNVMNDLSDYMKSHPDLGPENEKKAYNMLEHFANKVEKQKDIKVTDFYQWQKGIKRLKRNENPDTSEYIALNDLLNKSTQLYKKYSRQSGDIEAVTSSKLLKRADIKYKDYAKKYKASEPGLKDLDKEQSQLAELIRNRKRASTPYDEAELSAKLFGAPGSQLPKSGWRLIDKIKPHLDETQLKQLKVAGAQKILHDLEKNGASAANYYKNITNQIRTNKKTLDSLYSPEELEHLVDIGKVLIDSQVPIPNPSGTSDALITRLWEGAKTLPYVGKPVKALGAVGSLAKGAYEGATTKIPLASDVSRGITERETETILKPRIERSVRLLPGQLEEKAQKPLPTPEEARQMDDSQLKVLKGRLMMDDIIDQMYK